VKTRRKEVSDEVEEERADWTKRVERKLTSSILKVSEAKDSIPMLL